MFLRLFYKSCHREKWKFPKAVILTLLLAISISGISFSKSLLPASDSSGNRQFVNTGQEIANKKGEGIWIVLILALSYVVFQRIRAKEESPEKTVNTKIDHLNKKT